MPDVKSPSELADLVAMGELHAAIGVDRPPRQLRRVRGNRFRPSSKPNHNPDSVTESHKEHHHG